MKFRKQEKLLIEKKIQSHLQEGIEAVHQEKEEKDAADHLIVDQEDQGLGTDVIEANHVKETDQGTE